MPTTTPPGIGADDMDAFTQIRLLEEAMEDRFAMLQIQVESVGDGCPCIDGRCPCACTKGAPMREPPEAAAKGEDEFEDEKKDPWRAFGKKKRGGGPGGGGGGGPSGGDDDDDGDGDDGESDPFDHFDINTPDGEGRKLAHSYEFGKLSEAKDAKFLPEFDGKNKAGL